MSSPSKVRGPWRTPNVASIAVALGLIVVASAIAIFAPQYDVTLLVAVGLSAVAAMGLTLLLIAGQVSLGQAAFMAVGAYVSAILARDHGFPAIFALLAGVAASAICGAIVGGITLRLKGHFLPLATLAMGMACSAAIVAAGPVTGGASGFGQIPPLSIGRFELVDDRAFAIVVWSIVAVAAGGFSRLLNTRTGRAIAALKTDIEMAEVFGVNATRLRLLVFVVAATLAGLSGGLYAFYFKFISPAPFGLTSSINLLIACIFGGMSHPFGAVLGASAVTALEMFLQNTVARMLGLSGNVEMIVFGVVLIGVLLRWPGGIWSALHRAWPVFSTSRPARNIELTPSKRGVDGEDLLSVSGIGKKFGGLTALRDVSFSVGADQIVGLIGPNGAGKSTTFNIATGLTAPSEGSVLLMGAPPPSRASDLVHRGVSRTFQHVRIVLERTVLENVAFGAYAQGRSGMIAGMFGLDQAEEAATFAKAWRALEIVELDGLAHEPASRLAMGQARLVEVARALISRPRLLLLDEPAAGLRTGEKLKLVTLLHRLKRAGMSVLLVEHDMDLVMNCVDRVVVLDRGQGLMTGHPDEVRRDERVIAAYLGDVSMPDLRVSGLNVGYGRATVIESLDLDVKSGELVTVLGANGAGKSTLLNGIMGLCPPRAGSVTLDGVDLAGLRPEQLVARGVVLVPERRELFGNLPVEVNLRLGGYRTGAPAQSLERIYGLFPILAERRRQKAATLSGGEQQMLAVGRALMAEPRLLMLDEPSIGLAPLVVQDILRVIGQLKSEGLTIILVEQNARLALSVADRGYVLEVGRIVLQGSSAELSADARLSQAYLGGAADYAAARDQVYVD